MSLMHPENTWKLSRSLSQSNSLLDMLCRRGTTPREGFSLRPLEHVQLTGVQRKWGNAYKNKIQYPNLLISYIKQLEELLPINIIASDRRNSQVFSSLSIHLLIKPVDEDIITMGHDPPLQPHLLGGLQVYS